MRFVFYTHSLVSDWNHGNAHFLRGVMRELLARGHAPLALEPADGWSRSNLVRDHGVAALERFRRDFPDLAAVAYGDGFPHEEAVSDADVVIVHEWTAPEIVRRLGTARREGGAFTLIFHDTHHRAVSAAAEIAALALEDYDLVLAFGETLRERYAQAGWGERAVTWHEAADTELFRPRPEIARQEDIVWVGNWGDGERVEELRSYLLDPARRLGLRGGVHGVRYPRAALDDISAAGLEYRGWLANARVPEAFARSRATVHVPRRPYVASLPGIPTIRVFEALACGVPLVSAPWDDAEGLFRIGDDFLMARDGEEMTAHLRDVLHDRDRAAALVANGLETVRSRHTCAHRVDELLGLLAVHGTNRVRPRASTEAAE